MDEALEKGQQIDMADFKELILDLEEELG